MRQMLGVAEHMVKPTVKNQPSHVHI